MNLIKKLQPFNPPATLISIFMAVFSAFLIFNKMEKLPPELPLWFSKDWGTQRLARPDWLWIIPSLIILVFLVNQLMARLLYSAGLIRIIIWSSVVFGIIISYSLVRILILAT